MSFHKRITKGQVSLAFLVAIAADFIQIPLVLAMFAATASMIGIFADVPLEVLDIAIDVAAGLILNNLLGFHWALLPTFVLETVPGLDAAPVWTLCVAHVYNERKGQGMIDNSSIQ